MSHADISTRHRAGNKKNSCFASWTTQARCGFGEMLFALWAARRFPRVITNPPYYRRHAPGCSGEKTLLSPGQPPAETSMVGATHVFPKTTREL